MNEFQPIAYKTKKKNKDFLKILCIFFFVLLPISISQREVFQTILFGVVGLSCVIYLIVKYFEPKVKIKISPELIQLCYLTKTLTIKLSNINKVNYECACYYKRHIPTYESYGSVEIQEGGRKHYIAEIEDVKKVYEIIIYYKENMFENNKKEMK